MDQQGTDDSRTQTDITSDDLHQVVELRITPKQLLQHLGRLHVATLWGLGVGFAGIALGLISLGYKSYPIFNTGISKEIVRVVPTHINIKDVLTASDAQEQYPWLVPTISFLEDEVEAELASKVWDDGITISFRSEPFSDATPSFRVHVSSLKGELNGYAFRISPSNDKGPSLYEPLPVARGEPGGNTFVVPPCNKGDSLLFVVRISSNSSIDLPMGDGDLERSKLAKLISFEVQEN